MARLPSFKACTERCGALFTVLLLVSATQARADDVPYNPRDTYGEIGLLDMPSARNAPDGQLSFTAAALEGIQHYNLGFQILPWLEGSFRYSRSPNLLGPGITEFDRSFGVKIRLVEESTYVPQIAVGLRDLLGTGIYSGEYIVASKQIGDLDVTIGTGWGRFAQIKAFANPLAKIFPSFATRDTGFGLGGTLSFGQFFHGPNMGVFGGVAWRTPIDGLNLLAEYSPDRYAFEASHNTYKVRNPFNVGLSYHAFDVATISAGWFYGSSYGVTISVSADPTTNVSPAHFGADLPPAVIRPDKAQVDALALLMRRNVPAKPASLAAAWVDVPRTPAGDPGAALKSALISTIDGVRDVEVMGHTAVIDAGRGKHNALACNAYARMISSVTTAVDEVALTDATDPSGNVSICRVALADTGDRPIRTALADQAPGDLGDGSAVMDKVRGDIGAQALGVDAISIEPGMAWLYFDNTHYYSEAEAVGRVTRVLMADMPASVEVFHVISVKHGIPVRDFTISRSAMERASDTYASSTELGQAIGLSLPPLDQPVLDRGLADTYPRFHWSVSPALAEGFFDPLRPVQVQLFASLNADVELTPRLDIEGSIEVDIYNNFNLATPADSVLPHVRSDVLEYHRHGINGIARLDAVYRTRIARDVFVEAKAGYFESMFAGVGGQILWQPDGERFAVGADLYEVWQRDFDRLFGLRDYHVLTGHASIYYASPWYGLNFNVHAGRYLAGDYGATFEVTRRFSTGVEIGAFATFTNVPFAKFGEGSFDKGILIRIPFEWGLPFFSQSSYDLVLRSLTRDGGQRLDGDDSLHDELRFFNYGVLQQHLDDITSP